METLRNLYYGMLAKLSCEKGQTVIEYVLIIALSSIILMLAFLYDGSIQQSVSDQSVSIANHIAP